MDRIEQLEGWLSRQAPDASGLRPASADASFRRYFRIDTPEGTRIVMDAPPQHEDCRPFLAVARLFAGCGVHVPAVLAEDLDQGFLLLSDLGSTTYLQALDADNADALYRSALDALVRIQAGSQPGVLPDYDETLLQRELDLFPHWYVERHLGVTLDPQQQEELATVFRRLLDCALAQPRVFVHRDYHSRNLMQSEPNPGILDFQDAVYGPVTYDLVSLLKDAYIEWDEERTLDWAIRYWEAARRAGIPVTRDFAEFHRDYEWMGAQRHIKVLGIFARLYHRDGKDGYLKDLPLVSRHLRKVCERYRELHPLARLIDVLDGRLAQVGYTF